MREATLYRSGASFRVDARQRPHLAQLDRHGLAQLLVALLCVEHLHGTPPSLRKSERLLSYGGTSLIRNIHLLGPYSRTIPRVLGGS